MRGLNFYDRKTAAVPDIPSSSPSVAVPAAASTTQVPMPDVQASSNKAAGTNKTATNDTPRDVNDGSTPEVWTRNKKKGSLPKFKPTVDSKKARNKRMDDVKARQNKARAELLARMRALDSNEEDTMSNATIAVHDDDAFFDTIDQVQTDMQETVKTGQKLFGNSGNELDDIDY